MSLVTKPRLIAMAAGLGILAIGIAIGTLATPGNTEPVQALPTTTRSSAPLTPTALSQTELDALNASTAAATSRAEASEQARARASEAEIEQNRRAMEAQQAAADAQAAKFDRGTYATISERDYGILARDPLTAKGRKLVVHGYVTQFDTVTGSSTFRANTSGAPGSNWYDFDVNTIVNFDPKVGANVITNDIVTMYVEVAGTTTYTTTLGARETAPVLTANVIDVSG